MLKKVLSLPLVTEAPRATKKPSLPPDTYKDVLEPVRIPYNDSKHLVITTKRTGELGLMSVDIRWYVTTENYEGFTKKGITLPAMKLDECIDALQGIFQDLQENFPDDLEEVDAEEDTE